MVLGVVVSDGKNMLPFFFKAEEKIRKETYYKVLRTEWDNMSEEFLINSCKAFQRRVEAVFEAEGGHIE
ncbi:Uncharacterized protein FKW44_022843 [Caligus rogercresseyi]|uniref:Uncharacterized protein n=1 Tax=Caligus rogercresseyi TaxID=217165 RepID=A0A7T8GNJ5_CALRO|nr:Uncharacterized protein FKW44_022843 [Caligus rogercresseyi]